MFARKAEYTGVVLVVAVEKYKIAYMPMPKAACSSVKMALGSFDPALARRDLSKINHARWHKIYRTMRFRPHRWEAYEGPEWFRFCVVRDPLKRLLACYSNRVVQMQDLSRHTEEDCAAAGLKLEPDADFFFQNLEAYRAFNTSIKHHSIGARLFLGPKPLRYTRVYKTQELGLLAADLSERVGQEVTLPHANSSDVKLSVADLADETIESIRPFLNKQYEHLSEYYKNPL